MFPVSRPATPAPCPEPQTLDDTFVGLSKGSRVWYKQDPATWLLAEIKDASNGSLSIQLLQSGKMLEGLQDGKGLVVPANPALQQAIADLTQLSYLNEPSILDNLTQRYQADNIYTNAGPVLIAVNPCRNLPLYTADKEREYSAGASEAGKHVEPHIFLVAGTAFRDMVRHNTNQSVVISGESGAGKTETTKRAMQFFAKLAGGGVEKQVLETNPILEAFGNAKTLRNHNSSRFGKLIEIHFNKTNHICGARIRTYLLEKSRVVHQLKGERSFHIFYQLVRGASKDKALKEQLKLPNKPNEFVYLSKSGCVDIDGVNDAEDFKEVLSALSDIGVQQDDINTLLRTLSGILWLGNLKIEAVHADDSSKIKEDAPLSNAAGLLGLTEKELAYAITHKKIKMRKELIPKSLTAQEAGDARDALAKALYSGVFNWIVAAINAKLDMGKKGSGRFIAILDIYGFEQFQVNSFEQLCINYANERLQQQFTRHLLKKEQKDYQDEGINWEQVEWVDNQACVDLIEAMASKRAGSTAAMPSQRPGVLAVLNDVCSINAATDNTKVLTTFVDNLRNKMCDHPSFTTKDCTPTEFGIRHYAGRVIYSTTDFLDKNRDRLNQDLVELLQTSTYSLVHTIGDEAAAEMEGKRGGQTVSSRFTDQLGTLVSDLDATGLHFVRCIKPNAALAPGQLSTELVLQQLRCCGVLEVARVSRAGYPTRYRHEDFASRYQVLLSAERAHMSSKEACEEVLQEFQVPPTQYQMGTTKVFFKPGVLGRIEDSWVRLHRSVVTLQTFWRMKQARDTYLQVRTAAAVLQSGWRAHAARQELSHLQQQHTAAVTIQCNFRRHAAQQDYQRVRDAACFIQAGWRRCKVERAEHEALEAARRHEQQQLQNALETAAVCRQLLGTCDPSSVQALLQQRAATDEQLLQHGLALADTARTHLGDECTPQQLQQALSLATQCQAELGNDRHNLRLVLQLGQACHQAGFEQPAQLNGKLQLASAAAGASSPEDVAAALALQQVVLKAAGAAATPEQVAAALALHAAAEEQGIQDAAGLQAALTAAASAAAAAKAAHSGAPSGLNKVHTAFGSIVASAGFSDPYELHTALDIYRQLQPALRAHGNDPKLARRACSMYKAAAEHGIAEKRDFLAAATMYGVLRENCIATPGEAALAAAMYASARRKGISDPDDLNIAIELACAAQRQGITTPGQLLAKLGASGSHHGAADRPTPSAAQRQGTDVHSRQWRAPQSGSSTLGRLSEIEPAGPPAHPARQQVQPTSMPETEPAASGGPRHPAGQQQQQQPRAPDASAIVADTPPSAHKGEQLSWDSAGSLAGPDTAAVKDNSRRKKATSAFRRIWGA